MDDVSPEMKRILDYIDGKGASDEYTKQLEEAVRSARQNESWRLGYMTLEYEYRQRYEEGLKEGEEIELEFGYGIIPLADVNQGGDLLDRVVMIRRQVALELGCVVPMIRLRDNIQLNPNQYVIKIKGVPISEGENINALEINNDRLSIHQNFAHLL